MPLNGAPACRQHQLEAGAGAGALRHAHLAVVRLRDRPDDGQTEPAAGDVAAVCASLESIEDCLGIQRVDPGAGVDGHVLGTGKTHLATARGTGSYAAYPGLSVSVSVEGATVRVALTMPYQLPVPLPGVDSTTTIHATGSAQLPIY